MRMIIYICLSAFVLGCNVAAGMQQEIFKKNPVTLRCPHSVEGNVTWSRERLGNRVYILTVDGGRDIKHIRDPGRRYSSSADKSLHIQRAAVSDTGRYFCNNEPAVELTVIPPETVKEKNPVSLRCPHSVEGKVTWSRERNGTKVDILTADGDREIRHIDDPERRYNSSADKSLHIQRVTVSDTGRYLCNNEPAVELTVIPPEVVPKIIREGNSVTLSCPHSVEGKVTWSRERDGTKVDILTVDGDREIRHNDPDRRYSSSADKSLYIDAVTVSDTGRYLCNNEPAVQLTAIKGQRQQHGGLVLKKNTTLLFLLLLLLLLLLLIIITVVLFTRRCRCNRNRQEPEEETSPVYDEIQDGSVSQPTNDGGQSMIMTPPAGTSQINNSNYVLLGKPQAQGNTHQPYSYIFV